VKKTITSCIWDNKGKLAGSYSSREGGLKIVFHLEKTVLKTENRRRRARRAGREKNVIGVGTQGEKRTTTEG